MPVRLYYLIAAGSTIALLLLFGLHSPSTAAVKQAAYDVHEKVTGSFRPSSPPSEPISHAQPAQHAAPVDAPSDNGPYCRWVFDRYESSNYETTWLDLTANGLNDEVCNVVAQQTHRTTIHNLMSRIASLINLKASVTWATPDTATPGSAKPHDELLSRMHYKRECLSAADNTWQPASGRGVQLIEPLFGMLRDPYDWWCGQLALGKGEEGMPHGYTNPHGGQSKSHMVPQGYAPYAYTLEDAEPENWRQYGVAPWFTSLRPENNGGLVTFRSPQVVHLDLGSSYFAGWTMQGGTVNTAASGEWFYDHYHKRGQHFDRFIAVELEPLNPNTVFKQVPEDLMGKYTIMNVGLSMDKDKYNTMDLIRRVVQKEDFFVFKLDIDSAPIEMPIVNELLKDDLDTGVSQLIDELYFEHHVKFSPMDDPWHLMDKDPKIEGDLASSYRLFRDLRRKGIRAHSWP